MSEVAGYSGVTANGAGFTGAAPVPSSASPVAASSTGTSGGGYAQVTIPPPPASTEYRSEVDGYRVLSDAPPAQPSGYDDALHPQPVQIGYPDSEGLTITADEIRADPMILTPEQAQRRRLQQADGPPGFYADNRTEAQKLADERNWRVIEEIRKEYPWFTGTPGDWTWLQLSRDGLSRQQINDLTEAVNDTLRARNNADGLRSYDQLMGPRSQQNIQRPLPRPAR